MGPPVNQPRLEACAAGSLEHALGALLKLCGLSGTCALLGVEVGDIAHWAERAVVPRRYRAVIVAAVARHRAAEGEDEGPVHRGQWEQYRQLYRAGFGSYAEIAARAGVTRQAVGKAVLYGRAPRG